MPQNKLLLTQSLLSSWLYQYNAYDSQKAHDDFLRVLERKSTLQTPAIRNGIQFENMVAACCGGVEPEKDHEWSRAVKETADILHGAQLQVAVYKDKRIDNVPFLLYGRLDALKAGTIYDTKFSKTYMVGKYLTSPQHSMYLECVPEARKFLYVISDGKTVCTEEYRRDETPSIDELIRAFMRYLEESGLARTYIDNWKTN